ncbi:ankyrin repeat-containing domain protein [Aspergillus leporis]|uniref:Ankyrin repeat-containing domain protein n=1 Tax=Aspergillus leporis TaxID=41062 RepID=A0A5N5WUA6_9EURO|nr:ankyrin repeat-containing domain protein [Aspergillus leporis]
MGETMISIVISGGNLDNVIELLGEGALMITEHFILATQMKLYSFLELYLNRGWNINADVYFNDMTLLTWFLEHGADPNKRCRIHDCTPYSYAFAEAPLEAIEMLFRYGRSLDSLETRIYNKSPDANALDDFAMNFRAGLGIPFHYATLVGSLNSVEFLVEKGGDIWVLDPYRRTELSLAIHANHEQVVQFLKGLRLEQKDRPSY